MIARIARFLRRVVIAIVIIVVTVVLVRAFDSRRLPDLQVWHETQLKEEYSGSTHSLASYAEYIELENRLFEELDRRVHDEVRDDTGLYLNRYVRTSPAFPGTRPTNWNRSFEVPVDEPKAGILLLHGLTDSPYSMRATAELFSKQGFYVVAPRMPGHGTIPAGLRYATWEDWLDVVTLGIREVRDRIGPDAPLYVGGYSNGAALAVEYTLQAIDDENLETPQRIFLFSPMIGVTPFARFASWHRSLAWMPYFKKFAWESVYPEYDPFKYNSFPKAAGQQSFRITREIQAHLDRLDGTDTLESFPPTIVFQSLVDSTVLTKAIVDGLMDRLPNEGNELVLFDINRLNIVDAFLRERFRVDPTELVRGDRHYAMTLVRNVDYTSTTLVSERWAVGETQGTVHEVGLTWPPHTYSLSHVALPFPPDDTLYGGETDSEGEPTFRLGAINARGERAILAVPMDQLMRLRYNPLYAYQEARVIAFCPVCEMPAAMEPGETETN